MKKPQPLTPTLHLREKEDLEFAVHQAVRAARARGESDLVERLSALYQKLRALTAIG